MPDYKTLLLSISSSSALSAIIGNYLGRKKDRDIERLKDSLAKGAYLARAQFDLEVSAYKELWIAISDLRLNVRSFQMSDALKLKIGGTENRDWHEEAFPLALTKFASAHNVALMACDRYAPFYPEQLHLATYSISAADVKLLNFLAGDGAPLFSDGWYELLRPHVEDVLRATDEIEAAIRSRYNELKAII